MFEKPTRSPADENTEYKSITARYVNIIYIHDDRAVDPIEPLLLVKITLYTRLRNCPEIDSVFVV